MPTVLRWKGHRFFFWSGGRDEPPHAHVDHASKSVKIWLETLKVAYNDGYALHEVNAILNVVVYRARFFGHKAALCGLVRGDGCGHPVPPCFGGASVAVLFQEPVLVVAIEVRPDGGADLLDVLEDTSENDLLLQRADEALGDAVGFRLTDESEAGRHAEEPQLVLEVLGHEGAAVVVTQQHLARGIRADGSEHLADGQRQRLSGGITVSMFGNVPAEALGDPVLGDDEQRDVAVLDRRNNGAVGAQHDVRGTGGDRAAVVVRRTGRAPMRGEQGRTLAAASPAADSIRSERQLMERLEFDLLFRWFVGLSADEPAWDHSTFSKNRDRLLD